MPAQFPTIGFTNISVSLPAEPADVPNGVLLPLSAKSVTIKTLSDAGTWGEQHTARGSTAKIRMIWDTVDDWRIRKALLGYSYVTNVLGTNRLSRVTPYRRPKSRSKAYIRELNLVAFGRKSGTPDIGIFEYQAVGGTGPNAQALVGGVYMDTDGWPTAEKLVYEATFGPTDYTSIGAGDAASWAQPGYEIGRYIKGIRAPRPKELRIPASGFGVIYDSSDPAFIGSGTTPASIGTPILVSEVEYSYTWYQIPFNAIPEVTLTTNLNKVNSEPFDGLIFRFGVQFPIATMLFKGWRESDPYPGVDGQYYVDLTYIFGERGGTDSAANPITWHKVPQANGVYCLIKRDNVSPTKRLYEEADHRLLFMVP